MTRPRLGHIPFDPLTRAQALDAIGSLIDAGRGGYVVTPNVDHVVQAHRAPELRSVYTGASLSLADGQPLVWALRALGTPVPERVSGSDAIEPLMAQAASRRDRIFFFGATPAVSTEAARRLTARYTGLEIVGRDTSSWSPDDPTPPEHSPVVRAIHASGAQLVVVALGCPKQEVWMARHTVALAPAVAIGLGASLDFVAGQVRRAPAWMSSAGLEWVFRLAQEPGRLAHRYLVRDIQIIPIVARQAQRLLLGKEHLAS
jgi:N-acetylglucosaminyldiphosphoundecaprenol N-acetyl-beta-D-mannosaminyltransferase